MDWTTLAAWVTVVLIFISLVSGAVWKILKWGRDRRSKCQEIVHERMTVVEEDTDEKICRLKKDLSRKIERLFDKVEAAEVRVAALPREFVMKGDCNEDHKGVDKEVDGIWTGINNLREEVQKLVREVSSGFSELKVLIKQCNGNGGKK
jgi:hypothetical protein